MNKLSILVLAGVTCFSAAAQAAQELGAFYSNIGATLLSNDSHDESAYSAEVGYNQKLSPFLSLDLSYKRVETFDSSVSAGANDFAQKYDAYGVGLRADQNIGDLSIFAKAGGSYILSEITTWDSLAGAEKTDEDESLKPYASAGFNIASPYDKRLSFGVEISYQMLSDDEYATSFSGGVNYGF